MWKFILLIALFASAHSRQNENKIISDNTKSLTRFAGEIYQVCGFAFIVKQLSIDNLVFLFF